MEKKMLAAVVYDAGSGVQTDKLLVALADKLQEHGVRVAGTVQSAMDREDRCACDMIVRDLSTNTELKISEDRGPNARGCRLAPHVLETLVGSTIAALEQGVDVLIINKFGKQEALGAGFRDVISRAVADGVPTMIAVNVTYLDSWRAFASDFADELRPDVGQLRQWVAARLGGRPGDDPDQDSRSASLGTS
ncbi:MAG: DUF2478 domain-containing protein [Alphaproteobacteria bacterium]|nr:DUF2478 domain-containing protein [Alphaproteobacteria bacterium]